MTKIDQHSSLEEIFEHTIQILQLAEAEESSPLHFPFFATHGHSGVEQRTVVLRKFDAEQHILFCYTDFRSGKVQDIKIKHNAEAGWLFYDSETKEQLRVKTQIILHHRDDLAKKIWQGIPPKARKDYLGLEAPGTETTNYTSNLPEFALAGDFGEEETSYGFENFCVIEGVIIHMDFLALRKSGHIRSSFTKINDDWDKKWLAP